MKRYLLLTAATAALVAAPAFAQSVPYTGGNGTFTGLGADGSFPGTLFDQVNLTGSAGAYTGNGTYSLNSAIFTAGLNRQLPATITGSLDGLVGTFGGNPFTYSVNYSLVEDVASDTITLGGNTISVFGTPVYLNPLTLTSGGAPASGTLYARVGPAVPEPTTWAMMVLGFGMVGFGLRSRRKVSTKVSFA